MYVMSYVDARTNRGNYTQEVMSTLYKHKKIKEHTGEEIKLIPEYNYIKISERSLISSPEKKVYESKKIKSLVREERPHFNYRVKNFLQGNKWRDRRENTHKQHSTEKIIRKLESIYQEVTGENSNLEKKIKNMRETNVKKLKEIDKPYVMMLELAEDKEYISYKKCWKILMTTDKWINQIIEFFYKLTQYQVIVEESPFMGEGEFANVMEYFLFNKNGEIEKFIALNTLSDTYIPKGIKSSKIPEINNIKVLQHFLQQAYSVLIEECKKGNRFEIQGYIKKMNRSLMGKFKENETYKYPFKSFQEIKDYLEEKEPVSKKKIGVFLDNANIETSFYGFQADFYKIIHSVYDFTEQQEIAIQVSTLFFPQMKDAVEQEKSDRKKQTRKRYLERDEFEILEVRNGRERANQLDDRVLQDKILQSVAGLDKILILTGDEHFIDVFRRCRELGKELKIISTNKGSTADEIIEEFGEELSYLYEYYECIDRR